MRRNKWLKLGILLGTLLTSSTLVTSVQAASIMEKVESTETTEDLAEDTSYSLLRGNNLNHGSAKITKLSSYEINIYGLTQCHHECDKVWLDLYLEQKNNGSYSTYKYWQYDATNVTSLSKSLNVLVPSGHYYRLRGYHAAKDGTKESTSTLTDGIWVGN